MNIINSMRQVIEWDRTQARMICKWSILAAQGWTEEQWANWSYGRELFSMRHEQEVKATKAEIFTKWMNEEKLRPHQCEQRWRVWLRDRRLTKCRGEKKNGKREKDTVLRHIPSTEIDKYASKERHRQAASSSS